MPAIDIRNLSFTHPAGKRPALDSLSLTIEPGRFTAVIGANNAGKTTLCHALSGVIPHLFPGTFEGRVRICGNDIAETPISKLALSVAFVMQNPESQLSGIRFTVRDEIAFGLENQGVDRPEMLRRVDRALESTGLADLADRSPHHLSGGQLQKVALAAAIAVDTPVLILDEPTTFLDPASATEIFAILRRLKQNGKTIVVAEQRLDSVALHADRVLGLHQGRLALDGPPEEVLVSPALREIGLDWTRFTRIAALARDKGLWQKDAPLPATLEGTLNGLAKN
ncbi:MAG: ABC transporter ATP-binding protein [Desulfovibrionaceae bacterium]|nr:ABC transporter ATP-binding protein [Desulfovibrionaceae bacterium]